MRHLSWILVLLMLAAALGLRLRGLDWLLPHRMEPDWQIVAQERLIGRPDAKEHGIYGTYPLLSAALARLLPAPTERPPTTEMGLAEHRANAAADVVRVRLAVALLSLILIAGTYPLARKALGRQASLLATAFVAFSPLHQSLSQQARPHAVACGVFLLAVLAALRLRRKPTFGAYVGAGLAGGASLAALQSGPAALLPLAVAHLLRDRTRQPSSKALPPIALPAVAIAIAALLFVLGNPILPAIEDGSVRQGGHNVRLARFDGTGLGRILWTFWSYEPVPFVLAGLGLAAGFLRLPRERAGRADLAVALSFALPYLAAFSLFQGVQERMLLQLLPFLAVLAALPFDALLARLRGAGRAAALAIAVAALALPAWVCVRLSSLRAADDTIEEACAWIAASIDPGERVLYPFPLDPPLFHGRSAQAHARAVLPPGYSYYSQTLWMRYQLRVQEALAPALVPAPRHELFLLPFTLLRRADDGSLTGWEELDCRYALIELFPWRRQVPRNARIVASLHAKGRRVARFSPWRDESSEFGFEHEGLPGIHGTHFTTSVLRAQRLGPVVEILELER